MQKQWEVTCKSLASHFIIGTLVGKSLAIEVTLITEESNRDVYKSSPSPQPENVTYFLERETSPGIHRMDPDWSSSSRITLTLPSQVTVEPAGLPPSLPPSLTLTLNHMRVRVRVTRCAFPLPRALHTARLIGSLVGRSTLSLKAGLTNYGIAANHGGLARE